ncbi:protealysin inhibitor emfourin [Paracoccus salsus]|uniref:protealysin inhibitor emfourin n=1 Tax=Paracoccus salsus TaxID=2911061 RepID=UPI001F2AA109|nr:protealysin inhibitor emfourin [Paracoccus salsus]MCF3972818.1 hypothetical protein [Paracoccus salsus]
MIIEIAAEGGFGGIAAAASHKRIDVDQQAEPMRQELCEAFEPDQLALLADKPCTTCADRLTYRITVTDSQQHSQIFTIREDQLPPETLDLIDQM